MKNNESISDYIRPMSNYVADYENKNESDTMGNLLDPLKNVFQSGQSAVIESTKQSLIKAFNDPEFQASIKILINEQLKNPYVRLAGGIAVLYIGASWMNLILGLRRS